MIRILMKDKVNRVIHDNIAPDSFYELLASGWPDTIDEKTVVNTYPTPNTHPDIVTLMNASRARALMALREARIEQRRRKRIRGETEKPDDIMEIGGGSDISELSDPGSDIDGEDESDDEQSAGDYTEKD
jgi:hypothetical protein